MIIFLSWLGFVVVMGYLAWRDWCRINREYEKEIEAQNKRIEEYRRD